MVEPLSVTNEVLSLIGTVGKCSIAVAAFVKKCREARQDLMGISRELSELQQILEWLKVDLEEHQDSIMPDSLKSQIISIITDCSQVLAKIDVVIEKHSGRAGPDQWSA